MGDDTSNPPVIQGAVAVPAYDSALELDDRRELRNEEVIYDAAPAMAAAEAVTTRALTAADLGLAPDTALTALRGTVTNAGTTRIIIIDYIEAEGGV